MKMDGTTKLGQSVVHHGKNNNRAYLMKLAKEDFPEIIEALLQLSKINQYTKIVAKIPEWAKETFEENGYRVEAVVPGFYNGEDTSYFLARYLDAQRAVAQDAQKIEEITAHAQHIPALTAQTRLPDGFCCDLLTPKDAAAAAEVYKTVFSSYPFPVFSPSYLAQTMTENIVYFGVWHHDRLVAVSSCEMDCAQRNVEMTDFATLAQYRGQGLASFLLSRMHAEMKRRGILTAYTIARARSYGMNITFAKQGYTFGGTLINNTDISGAIESMNVWYLRLKA